MEAKASLMIALTLVVLIVSHVAIADEETSHQPQNLGNSNSRTANEAPRADIPYWMDMSPKMNGMLIRLIRNGYLLRPSSLSGHGGSGPYDMMRHRRKFPEVDSKGFDEDIFDEGFGDFSTMKRARY